MKTISLTTILMIILFSTVAFATSVNTDYEGMGDFYMETTIISPVAPDITDTVDINTGCDGGCCCCPDCFGEYSGNQYMTNNPFSASVHTAEVTEGCVVIEQYYTDYIDGHTIESYYYTYFNGTGTAESYIYVVPGLAESYQLANGTGSSYVSFSQIAYIGTEFDFSTTYGGAVWLCAPGYAGLYNQYYYSGGQIYYNSEMGLYCSPTDGSSMDNFLFASATDHFSLNSQLEIGDIESTQNVGVGEGEAEYGFTAIFYDMFDDLYFGFEMELG
ncbi:MAG: hypothetical protein V1818_00935 [Candidatus Aenigmatarchaeota archaeon]